MPETGVHDIVPDAKVFVQPSGETVAVTVGFCEPTVTKVAVEEYPILPSLSACAAQTYPEAVNGIETD